MKKIYLYMTSIFSILFTTVAYSSLMTNISITSEVTIRAQSDIRITDIELYLSEESIISYESKYSKNTTTNGFVLSNTNSSISYSVTITNNGEIEKIFNFYYGILKGSEDSINWIINEKENNSKIEIVNENINNIIYKNTYLIND